AHGVGTGRAGRGHAAKTGIGAWIDGEEQARVAQVIVKLLAGDTGLDHAIEVCLVHRDDTVHARQVERDAAEWRVDMTFERGTGAKWNYGHARRRAELHDIRDFGLRLSKYDGVGRFASKPGESVGVLLAQSVARR